MTFANVGRLVATPGRRDDLVEILTRGNEQLAQAGCLVYEVGTHNDDPDAVFVMELWTSADAHAASLRLPRVRSAIAEAMPLLTGEMSGHRFAVVGSPLEN